MPAKLDAQSSFFVKHTIGTIKYNAQGFIFKNKDVLRPEMVEVVQVHSSFLCTGKPKFSESSYVDYGNGPSHWLVIAGDVVLGFQCISDLSYLCDWPGFEKLSCAGSF